MKMIEYIHRRALMFIFVTVGIGITIFLYTNQQTARKETRLLRERVVKVESTSPCTNLTSAECALKLFRALPEETKRRLRVTQSTIRALEQRARRERQDLRRNGDRFPPSSAGGRSPGRVPDGSSPSSGSRPRPGSSPVTPAPAPQPSPTPSPIPTPTITSPSPPGPNDNIKTPEVVTPQVGPVPALTVPSIAVPCDPRLPVTCKQP